MLLEKHNNLLSLVKEVDFENEKELQNLCELNLLLLLNLEFVATEFTVLNFRLDTVAYDKEDNAFVIIEYKNGKNISVIDQGYSYLSAMLNHKADFVLEYSNKTNKVHSIKDINWEKSKIIFISPHFTNYQMHSINFKDLPIELWKIKKYSNNTVLFEQIKPINATATISDVDPMKNEITNTNLVVSKSYSEDELLFIANQNINDLYYMFKEFILSEDEDITIKATKLYVSFIKNRRSLICIQIQKKSLIISLNTKFKNINDERNIVRDVSKIGHYGLGDCEIKVFDNSNIGYIQDIIKKYLLQNREH